MKFTLNITTQSEVEVTLPTYKKSVRGFYKITEAGVIFANIHGTSIESANQSLPFEMGYDDCSSEEFDTAYNFLIEHFEKI